MSPYPPVLGNLNRIPSSTEVHHWADYVELLCLTNLDGLISKSDFLDRWAERRGLGEVQLDEVLEDEPSELDADVISRGIGQAPVENDRATARADDIFRHLTYRSATFGTYYPFNLSGGGALQRRQRLSRYQKLYIFLLLSSCLRYLARGSYAAVTRSFEQLAAYIMRSWLPPSAEVHVFGTTAGSESRYRGSLFQKLQTLARDLRADLQVKESEISPQDSGDAGADVVAWFPMGDEADSLVVFLAQATCQLEWVNKQHESGHAAWTRIMKFACPHTNVLFVPFCFRDPSGQWYRPRTVQQAVLIDRVRLLWLLRAERGVLEAVPYDLVDRALSFRESIF